MKKIIFLILIHCIVSCSVSGQKFTYKTIPTYELYLRSQAIKSVMNKFTFYKAKAHDVTNDLPENYDLNGKVDYTTLIQKAIRNNAVVLLPNIPLFINMKGIDIPSDRVVLFGEKTEFLFQANSKDIYEVIRIHNAKNVKLFFPVVVGDRKFHTGTTGEWGMGVSIRGGQNIEIFGAEIKDCWGDGIYIGDGSISNSRVNISFPLLDNNRRNGISIISGEDIKIYKPIITNTNGTRPMAGIDIEPNSNKNKLKSIVIQDPFTFNNGLRGILIALNSLYGQNHQNIDVSINNHVDKSSGYGLGLSIGRLKKSHKYVEGNITVRNPVWENNSEDLIQYYDVKDNRVKVNIISVKTDKQNKFNTIKSKYKGSKVTFN